MISDIYLYQWREVDEIYRLLAPHIWKQYKDLDLTDFREQNMLDAALKNLSIEFRKVLTHGEVAVGEDTEEYVDGLGDTEQSETSVGSDS